MRGDLVVDGRNLLDPEKASAAGLRYVGVGRVKRRHADVAAATVYENEITRSTT
jgi:hypothetical protein